MADEKATLIDAQAEVEGKLKGKDAVVHGRFKGEIALSGQLVLGEGARVEATDSADAVELAGEVGGSLLPAEPALYATCSEGIDGCNSAGRGQ